MTLFRLSLLSAFVIWSCLGKEENTTLLLVQTIFRHGDRAAIFPYPTDPNGRDSWPNGAGELTQLGKQQQYAYGKFMRHVYKDFVTSNPNEVLVFSASERRCINSAAANLAAFYAPDEDWKFVSDLDWQPIPIFYERSKMDIYLNHRIRCPRNKDEFNKALKSERIQEFYRTHQDMVADVTNRSGIDYTDPDNAYKLFNILTAERIHNLTIPEWAQNYWDDMSYVCNEVFEASYSSSIALRLGFGPFLEKITENLQKKISGKIPNLKFIINSSHGVNLAGVLQALNFTTLPKPPHGATLMFELHEMANASMAVRLRYLNSTDPLVHMEEPNVLVLEGCSEFCPVEFFTKSYQWLIPDNWEEECQMDSPITTNLPTHETSGSQPQTRHIFEKYLLFIAYIFCLYLFYA